MSSGNLVSVIYVPETVYGTPDTPLSSVTAETARLTSESISGTPTTTSSTEIRRDRMSGGLVVTGLEVGGSQDNEFSFCQYCHDYFSAAMMSDWMPAETIAGTTVTLTPDAQDNQQALLEITDDFTVIGLTAGDMIQVIPATGMPVVLSVISVDSTTEATVATKRGEVAIAGEVMDVAIPEHLEIGKQIISFTVGKQYEDVLEDLTVNEYGQKYSGTMVDGFSLTAVSGDIISGSYNTVGNGYEQVVPSYQQEIITAGGTVNPAEDTAPLNASVDFPLMTINSIASDFCVQTVTVELSNNLDPTTCLGKVAPTGYSLGTASITISLSAYLSNTSYTSLMAEKLSLTPISIGFASLNTDGGYGFVVTQAQLTFPDPATSGQDTQTMIDAEGAGKVGVGGTTGLYIYKLVGEQ